MGVFGGPEIPNDGLVLALDGANFKSFKGEATTNLIPSPTVNAYPTTGNGWGSYNTNQYNGAQYFSIGSIVSVSGNVITTSGNHSLRTYDVMNPQSTGGGVNAGTNYFIKKVSDTSFTLHEYNGSQDGSQGYINPSTGNHKVYDSIANDTRISVNSTSFPTMWWGYAHQPNSGLVKELRYGEFNAIPNLPANDCIRLHYIRTDDVKDGMSYNVDCTVTPSSPVTVSFYTRAANANAVGKVIQYQIYNYTGGNAAGYAMNFTLGAVGVWERQTFTFTPAYGTMISYWFPVSGGVYAWDWSCMQVEQKSYVTNFVAGTRGTTVATGGGWADLIGNGNHGELVSGVRESSDNLGSLSFDGSNDYSSHPYSSLLDLGTQFTISSFIKFSNLSTTSPIFAAPNVVSGVFTEGYMFYYYPSAIYGMDANTLRLQFGQNNWGWNIYASNGISITDNNLHFVSVTASNLNTSNPTITFYIDGNSITGTFWNASSKAAIRYSSDTSSVRVASTFFPVNYDGPYYLNGNIAQVSIYNRALSAAEISQNFIATRSRYGI